MVLDENEGHKLDEKDNQLEGFKHCRRSKNTPE